MFVVVVIFQEFGQRLIFCDTSTLQGEQIFPNMSSSRRNLQKYAERDMDFDEDEFNHQDRLNHTIRNSNGHTNNNSTFRTSVIRHKSSRNNVNDDEEFSNMLHAMDINRRSQALGEGIDHTHKKTVRRSKSNNRIPNFGSGQGLPRSQSMKLRGQVGDLSIVQEGFSDEELDQQQQPYEPDNDFITLTKENIKKFNDYHTNTNPRLKKYIDPHNYNERNDEDDFEDDFELDEKITNTLKLTKQLPRSRSFNMKSSSSRDIDSHTNKNSQFTNMPVSNSTITAKQLRLPTSQSMRSLSSFTSSSNGSSSAKSIDAYSEESGTEESDYADDYELDQDNEEDIQQISDSNYNYLLKKFERRKEAAEERANLERKLKEQRSQTFQRNYHHSQAKQHNIIEYDHSLLEDDFDDFEELDNLKLQRFMNKNNLRNSNSLSNFKNQPHLNKKISMPNGFMNSQYGSSDKGHRAGSPKRNLRKASSTLELSSASYNPDPFRVSARQTENNNNNSQLLPRQQPRVYNGSELDDIDMELDPNDITITIADLKMLHQKRLIDLSKYAEQPSVRHRHSPINIIHENGIGNTITERLNREGKIKMIKNLAKSKTRQSLPGHKYGEMVYDPHSMKWFGNEDELTKFEMTNKPALIKSTSAQNSNLAKRQVLNKRASTLNLEASRLQNNSNQTVKKRVATLMDMPNAQVVENMIYDPEKLRWISISGKYEDDPFDNMDMNDSTIIMEDNPSMPSQHRLESLNPPPPMPRYQSSSQRSPVRGENLVSRAISQPSSPQKKQQQIHDGLPAGEDFLQISKDQYKQWKGEEARWERKVGNWFPNDDDSFKFCYDLKLFLSDNQ